jgi:hypothetical protein
MWCSALFYEVLLYYGRVPRTARASVGGVWYHVLNRGNRQEPVFHESGDYDAFVEAISDARARLPLDWPSRWHSQAVRP